MSENISSIISSTISCEDIGLLLKEMRSIDDKIIYQLNLATPTTSFRKEVSPKIQCHELYDQLEKTYTDRHKLISRCVDECSGSVRKLAEKSKEDQDDFKTRRNLRTEQSKLRELKNELTIEEIIRNRSLKAFEEKCKMFFRPFEKK